MDAAQGADRGFQNFGGQFFLFLQQDRGQQAAVGFGGRNFQNIGNFGPGIEQGFGQGFGREAAVQAFILQDEVGLACGIEFFFGAVAGGEMFFVGLDLASGGQGADQDFSASVTCASAGALTAAVERVLAAWRNSWRRTAESICSFCAISCASSSRTMRLGMRWTCGSR